MTAREEAETETREAVRETEARAAVPSATVRTVRETVPVFRDVRTAEAMTAEEGLTAGAEVPEAIGRESPQEVMDIGLKKPSREASSYKDRDKDKNKDTLRENKFASDRRAGSGKPAQSGTPPAACPAQGTAEAGASPERGKTGGDQGDHPSGEADHPGTGGKNEDAAGSDCNETVPGGRHGDSQPGD